MQAGLAGWRPDGSPLDAAELKWLKSDLDEFGSLKRIEPRALRPLHLVFRVDERATKSIGLMPSLIQEERRIPSLARSPGSSRHHLALAILSPSQLEISRWPSEIDLEIRMPIEDGGTFYTLKKAPDEPIDFDPGVRLFWSEDLGRSRSGQTGYPAVALEIDLQQCALIDYSLQTCLKNGKATAFNSGQITASHELKISEPLTGKDAVERIEVGRRRNRMERYEKVPIFPERIPK